MINKRGQTMGISIITAAFIFIIFLMSVNFVIDEVTVASASLNCTSASTISDGTKLLCLAINSTVIYWIWLAISISVGVILVRLSL